MINTQLELALALAALWLLAGTLCVLSSWRRGLYIRKSSGRWEWDYMLFDLLLWIWPLSMKTISHIRVSFEMRRFKRYR